jgi:8-oxo-dGTP pyrophosphatase MutT (NUDIX family)
MARSLIQAAGGIVFRSGTQHLIAVVQLSKGDDWVLPKGKLNPRETPKAAAKREVLEETGFEVTVHEFLGKLKYSAGGKVKVVRFWRMEASRKVREPMDDVRGLEWLPLTTALKRLTRSHEREFLSKNGPLAENFRKQSITIVGNTGSRTGANNLTSYQRSTSRSKVVEPPLAKRVAGQERKSRKSDQKRQPELNKSFRNSLFLFWKRLFGAG